jgi:hypothetical protein
LGFISDVLATCGPPALEDALSKARTCSRRNREGRRQAISRSQRSRGGRALEQAPCSSARPCCTPAGPPPGRLQALPHSGTPPAGPRTPSRATLSSTPPHAVSPVTASRQSRRVVTASRQSRRVVTASRQSRRVVMPSRQSRRVVTASRQSRRLASHGVWSRRLASHGV